MRLLCVTFRFIQPFPIFHGCADAGAPEWPPSPLRAFQALLNATALRHRGRELDSNVRSALDILEAIRPYIIAPMGVPATVGYRTYVPHNQTDLVTSAWDRGNLEASIASHRMEKDVRPTRIAFTDDSLPAVHYVYPLDLPDDACNRLLESVRPSVRSITALGWGIDQVIADATLISQADLHSLEGEQWRPASTGVNRLRVHCAGSLDALSARHEKFLNRISDGKFTPVPPLTKMEVVAYRRDTDPAPRPHAVFKLIDANEDAYRYPHAKLIHVAGMVRHLAIERMTNAAPAWITDTGEWVNRVVRGKRDASSAEHQQFSYVPLPSIGHEHADAMIRNVMIVAPLGMERELNYLAERLNGEVLRPEGDAAECDADSKPQISQRIELQKFNPPSGKFISKCYLGLSRFWHTVTPVILDGHNRKSKNDKPEEIARATEKLICKALQRWGIETPCEFTWQSVPFLKNTLSAHKYDRDGRHTGYHRPAHLKDLTAVHVRLSFSHPVPGPLTLGAGRHCGFGLMAAVQS
ncbi:MAG TPA: type I-U CRISPR-associated protein Csb2 [Humisphaera sp.]|nr:type I-U CRISPR-associated protein Csb2 [Humisphaera sp.]